MGAMERRMGNKKYQDIVIESIRKIERQAETILKSISHEKRKAILKRDTGQDMVAFADTSEKNTARAKSLENLLLKQQVIAAYSVIYLLSEFSDVTNDQKWTCLSTVSRPTQKLQGSGNLEEKHR